MPPETRASAASSPSRPAMSLHSDVSPRRTLSRDDEVASLQSQLTASFRKSARLGDEVGTLSARVAELEAQLSEAEARNSALEAAVETLREREREATRALRELQLAHATDETARWKAANSRLQEELKETRSLLAEAERHADTADRWNQLFDGAQRDLESTRQELSSVMEELDLVQNRNVKLGRDKAELEAKLDELEDKLSDLQREQHESSQRQLKTPPMSPQRPISAANPANLSRTLVAPAAVVPPEKDQPPPRPSTFRLLLLILFFVIIPIYAPCLPKPDTSKDIQIESLHTYISGLERYVDRFLDCCALADFCWLNSALAGQKSELEKLTDEKTECWNHQSGLVDRIRGLVDEEARRREN